MLVVKSITDTLVDYNGHTFVLGSVGSQKVDSYPATFPIEMGVKEGDYLDEISMDLTTAHLGEDEYIDCIRISDAVICSKGELDVLITLNVLGRVLKPRNLGPECPRVGLDAKPNLRFTLKSKDAYGRYVCRPALAKKMAPKIFEIENRALILATISIKPDNVHGHVLYVQAFELRGGI